jgi:hypothetical protein
MDDFASAFIRAYQMGSQNRREREERQATKGLADLIAKDAADMQASTKDRLVDNPNYQFGQSIPNQAQSLNDLLPKNDFSLQPNAKGVKGLNSLLASSQHTGQGTAPTNAGFTPQATQPFSLNSLLPKAEPTAPSPVQYAKAQPMQAFDFNKMNNLIAKGTGLGLDYNTAAKMVGNYKGMYDDQYNKVKESQDWDTFNTLKTPQEKLMFAARNKMPMESIKMLLSPDVESQVVDLGGTKKIIGRNKYTNDYTDLLTGKPLTADDFKVTMTEYQQRSLDDANYRHNTPSASTVYATEHRVGSSGGYSKSDLAGIDKEIGFLQSQLTTHSAQERYDTGDKDYNGKPVFGYRQRNAEKAAQIQQQIDGLLGLRQQMRKGETGRGSTQTVNPMPHSTPELGAKIQAAVERGIPQQEIIDALVQDGHDRRLVTEYFM